MGPISHQTELLVDSVPGFRDAVDHSLRTKGVRPVQARLSAVEDDPMRLYAILEYARQRGVKVTFLPDKPL